MDWDNERYVRSYTKDTVNRLLLPWQSRHLLDSLWRKFDRAGLIDLGEHDPVLAVAALLGDPEQFVADGLPSLLTGSDPPCKIIQQAGKSYLYSPNFLDAQEAQQSNRARSKKSRETRRDKARLNAIVTKRAETVRPVSDTKRDGTDRQDPKPHGTDTKRDATDTKRAQSDTLARSGLTQPGLAVVGNSSDDGGESPNTPEVPSQETHSPKAELILEELRKHPVLESICTMALAEQGITNMVIAGGGVETVVKAVRDLAQQAGTAAAAKSPWEDSYILDRYRRYTCFCPNDSGKRGSKSHQPQRGDSEERRKHSREAWEQSEEYAKLAAEAEEIGI